MPFPLSNRTVQPALRFGEDLPRFEAITHLQSVTCAACASMHGAARGSGQSLESQVLVAWSEAEIRDHDIRMERAATIT